MSTKLPQQYKIGLVGLGRWGKILFEYFKELEELNGPTVDPDEDDMEPTDNELSEIE